MPEQSSENAPWLRAVARRVAPPTDSPSEEMLIAFVGLSSIFGFFGTLVGAVALLYTGPSFGPAMAMVSAVLNLVGLVALKRGLDPRSCGALLMAGFFLSWSTVTLAGGGRNPGIMSAGIVLPLYTVLVLGVRAGIVATTLAVGTILASLALRNSGIVSTLGFDAQAAANDAYVGALMLPLVTLAALVLHLHMRRAAQFEAETQARARTEAELRTRTLGDEFDRLRILSGSVAHDFNNFLFTIRGNAELAYLDAPEGSPLADSLGAILKSSDNAAGVVKDLLTFAKRGGTDRTTLDLRTAVTDVVEAAGSAFDRDFRIAPFERPLWVRVDADALSSVVLNLLKNAVEAHPDRGLSVTVSTRIEKLGPAALSRPVVSGSDEPGDYAVLAVDDDGPGIPVDEVERIFEPFVSTKSEGRGLGLAVARSFVESHSGAIDVSSRPGRTRFEIMLPIVSVPDMVPEFVQPRGIDLEGLRILVVDDDPSVRRVTCAMLENQGATVVEADGGLRAIELLEGSSEAIDLALIDVAMPGLGGEDTFHALRTRAPALPAVIMSGHAESEFEHLAELPGVRTLRKPFSLPVLAEKIDQLLDERAQHRD